MDLACVGFIFPTALKNFVSRAFAAARLFPVLNSVGLLH